MMKQRLPKIVSAIAAALLFSFAVAANAQASDRPAQPDIHVLPLSGPEATEFKPGDGLLTVLKTQRIGATQWYWVHYRYRYLDGHEEQDDIPWPFHYGPGEHDPFAMHDRRVAMQPPPIDFTPTRQLKPVLMQFFGGPAVPPTPSARP